MSTSMVTLEKLCNITHGSSKPPFHSILAHKMLS